MNLIVIEIAKLVLGAYITSQRNAGKTEAEIDTIFIKLKADILALDPSTLPDAVHDPDKD
jgi:hypothetical protein